MNKLSVLALGLIAVLGLAPDAAASTAVGTYTIGTTPVVSVVCSPNCLGVPDANIGGFQFAGTTSTPTRVDIADDSGGNVAYTICQDTNGDSLCGDTGEPTIAGCGTTVDLAGSAIAFRAGLVTSVFIQLASPADCDGVALGGIITLTSTP